MNVIDDKDGERRRTSDRAAEVPASRSRARKKRNDPDLGNALRTAYQRTIEEDIPPEMLDLLGKLG